MYVRFPFEAERSDNDFRDFRIGQIRDINTIAHTTLIRFDPQNEDEPSEIECSLNHIERCRILPDTLFTTLYVGRSGRILIHCSDEWTLGEFLDYYVLFDGEKEVKRRYGFPPFVRIPAPINSFVATSFKIPCGKAYVIRSLKATLLYVMNIWY